MSVDRLDVTACALAHVLRANQAHAHPDERVDLTRSPLVDGAFQAFAEAWDEFCPGESTHAYDAQGDIPPGVTVTARPPSFTVVTEVVE